MADYPAYSQSKRTKVTPFVHPATDVQATTNGVARLVIKGDAEDLYYVFNLVHEYLDTPDRDALIAHYKSDFANSFNMTYQGDGVIYSCFYERSPEFNWVEGNYWIVTNKLIGVVP